MIGSLCTTFYHPSLNLACILLNIEVYNAGMTTQGRNPLLQVFSTKSSFCSFFFLLFFRRCTTYFDFKRVFKLQQLLYLYLRTQAPLCVERRPESNLLQLFKIFSATLKILFFFPSGFFFHEHSRLTGQPGKGEATSLTPL